jgi:hypothetical protein
MLSENLIGQTRRFSSDEAHWECTVVALKNSHTALVKIKLSDELKTTEHVVSWSAGELADHGFTV